MSSDLYRDSDSGAMRARVRYELALAIAMVGVFLMNVPGWRWAPVIMLFTGCFWGFWEVVAYGRHLRPGKKSIFSNADKLEQHGSARPTRRPTWC